MTSFSQGILNFTFLSFLFLIFARAGAYLCAVFYSYFITLLLELANKSAALTPTQLLVCYIKSSFRLRQLGTDNFIGGAC